MPKVVMYNVSGGEVGEIELNDQVFGIEPNKAVLHQAVVLQLASMRQGTHDVKGRSEVRGGGRKPWRQKGTGRARQGSIRAPQWVGGGIVFGPTPRKYGFAMPRKMRRLAIRSALSAKVQANEFMVLDELNLSQPKTKEVVKILSNLNVNGKALVVAGAYDENIALSTRNIPYVKFITAKGINTLDVLNYDKMIVTKEAVKMIEEGLLS